MTDPERPTEALLILVRGLSKPTCKAALVLISPGMGWSWLKYPTFGDTMEHALSKLHKMFSHDVYPTMGPLCGYPYAAKHLKTGDYATRHVEGPFWLDLDPMIKDFVENLPAKS